MKKKKKKKKLESFQTLPEFEHYTWSCKAKQIMHKPRNQSVQSYSVFVPHASSEWYLRCVKFFFSHLECPEMTL